MDEWMKWRKKSRISSSSAHSNGDFIIIVWSTVATHQSNGNRYIFSNSIESTVTFLCVHFFFFALHFSSRSIFFLLLYFCVCLFVCCSSYYFFYHLLFGDVLDLIEAKSEKKWSVCKRDERKESSTQVVEIATINKWKANKIKQIWRYFFAITLDLSVSHSLAVCLSVCVDILFFIHDFIVCLLRVNISLNQYSRHKWF